MLKDNIKALRQAKGLSQEELALQLNVVRQTISKWEQGLSVPDSELLVSLSKVLDTPVSTLLGENILKEKEDSLSELAKKLELINLQLIKKKELNRKIWHYLFITIFIIIILIFLGLFFLGNKYMEWDYNDPELAILGVGIHSFIWLFVRIAPIVLVIIIIGIYLTRKK